MRLPKYMMAVAAASLAAAPAVAAPANQASKLSVASTSHGAVRAPAEKGKSNFRGGVIIAIIAVIAIGIGIAIAADSGTSASS